jgi:hypothetical protein
LFLIKSASRERDVERAVVVPIGAAPGSDRRRDGSDIAIPHHVITGVGIAVVAAAQRAVAPRGLPVEPKAYRDEESAP